MRIGRNDNVKAASADAVNKCLPSVDSIASQVLRFIKANTCCFFNVFYSIAPTTQRPRTNLF
jgi:hypothetical protein